MTANWKNSGSAASTLPPILHRSSISCAARTRSKWSKRRNKCASFAAKRADIPTFYVTTLYCNRDRRLRWRAAIEGPARGAWALMRITVVAAAVCISSVGLALANSTSASSREPTHIAAQGLGPALKQLAQSRGLQVLYLSNTVRDVRTNGANGDITANQALEQLLSGTGLTYRYLDDKTVTVIPISASSLNEGAGISLQAQSGGAISAAPADEKKRTAEDRIRLAQAPPTPAPQAVAAAAEPAPLTEVIVTGSRIASPNEVSTSPIQVVSSKSIQVSGKTDISDIITQLPQNYNNDLGQDLGNGTSGLATAGGVATADLRGLGPARTLVLIDGRRLGVGSPNTAITQPAPDLDQIPAGLVERVEVVTGGASAAYGSDAIAGVVNFIMKKNFEGFQLDGQVGENLHENHDK